MDVVILSARTGWHTDELCRALTARSHRPCVLPYEGLHARLGGTSRPASLSIEGTSLLDVDAVLARIIPGGSLEQIIHRVDALHWIEERGIAVMNSPRAIERAVDKFYTTALLREAGLPVPETVVCERLADAMDTARAMLADGDVLLKPIFGSMGHGLVRLTDPDAAFRVLRSLEQIRAVFYLQRAIEHGGRDIRVFVVGERIVGSIERRAPDGDWRTNVALGGSALPFELPDEWARLALRAAATVGADYAGVDLLPSRDGTTFVLEVNAIPGWQGLQRATGVDVAAAIAEHLELKLLASSHRPSNLAAESPV
jgi:RimK family alpha-L-glutamate ligase